MKALVRWPPDPGPSPKSLKRGKPQKRLQKGATGKAVRKGPRQGDSNVLQRWLLKEKEGLFPLPYLSI